LLARTKRLFKVLTTFSRAPGGEKRDYLVAAVSNPREFASAVRRFLKRRARLAEGEARATRITGLDATITQVPISFDTLLAGLSEHVGVLVLTQTDTALRFGVGDIDLLTAVFYLNAAIPDAAIKADGKVVGIDSALSTARIQSANTIEIEFVVSESDALVIRIENYQLTEPGKWLSSNASNRLLRAVYGDVLGFPGLVHANDLLGAPSLRARADLLPVDAVYTWVNHEDPDWQHMYAHWSALDKEQSEVDVTKAVQPTPTVKGDALALSRFHNNDELRYSLRSLEKNMPWIRQILIFSNCAPPKWLATDHPRLRWVRHEEVIPAEFLPTFSSHVIESYLHHLPGLADNFIYLNDDFFVARPMSKVDFFTETGQSQARVEKYGMVSGAVREGDPDYLNASRNSAALVREAFGFAATQLHQHVPYALLRPVLCEIEDRFRARIDAFRPNRFRRSNDVNIPSFLYHHYAMGCGKATVTEMSSIMVKSNDLRWRSRLEWARDKKHYFICINEGGAEASPLGWHAAIRKFLQDLFPKAAAWELPPS
jgi:Stealth protein CR2, conserved region 2/Stealth protein CR3, conserved region 3